MILPRFWTDYENDLLRQLWTDPTVRIAIVASRMGRSDKSVTAQAGKLQLGRKARPPKEPRLAKGGGEGFWTPERVEVVVERWKAGDSASQIAHQLGGSCTRNAVISKVHRMGLERSDAIKQANYEAAQANRRARRSAVPRPKREPRQARPPRLPVDPHQPAPVLVLDHAKPWSQRQPRECEWILNSPDLGEMGEALTCCAEKVPGLPYCGSHAAAAYTPPKKRERANRAAAYHVHRGQAA